MLSAIATPLIVLAAALLFGVARHRLKLRIEKLRKEQEQTDERLDTVVRPREHL